MADQSSGSFWRPITGRAFGLVVCGAALWGTDPLFRSGLTTDIPASAIVLVEHLLPVAIVLPLVLRGLIRARRTFDVRDWLTLAVLGVGSSALATVLFTMSFTISFSHHSGTTPILLQQVQPLIAVGAAWLLLRERPRPIFAVFLVAGLAGAYLVAFAHPTAIGRLEGESALLAVGAAALWGLGTVLGRRLTAKVPFGELTALRLAVGLVAAAAMAISRNEVWPLAHVDMKAVFALVALALVPGLLSLLVYYRGLRGTPASAATLGELAFPLTALLVGFVALHDVLTVTQWVGAAMLTATITVMGTTKPQGTPTAVSAPPLLAAVDA